MKVLSVGSGSAERRGAIVVGMIIDERANSLSLG